MSNTFLSSGISNNLILMPRSLNWTELCIGLLASHVASPSPTQTIPTARPQPKTPSPPTRPQRESARINSPLTIQKPTWSRIERPRWFISNSMFTIPVELHCVWPLNSLESHSMLATPFVVARKLPEGAGQLRDGRDAGHAVRRVRGDVVAGKRGRLDYAPPLQ